MCLYFQKLDPCHYFSSPGLNQDIMLRMTQIKIEKDSHIDMHFFNEKDQEEEFLALVKDIVKQITKT